MKLLLAIDAPAWREPVDPFAERGRRAKLAEALRDIAESVRLGGNAGTLDRPTQGLRASWRIENEPAADADAA